MPQLRWTLLFLGVVFVILLAWIERRRQRQQGQGFADSVHLEKEPAGDSTSGPVFREPTLTLPEMRAGREPAAAHDLPVVQIEDDSLDLALEVKESRPSPPTLSLPVVGSGPELARRRPAEPTVSELGLDSLDFTRTDVLAEQVKVPRLDKPAPKPVLKINLADTHHGPGPHARIAAPEMAIADMAAPGKAAAGKAVAGIVARGGVADSDERAFNDAVFGDPSLSVGPGIGATLPGGDVGTDVDASGSQIEPQRSAREVDHTAANTTAASHAELDATTDTGESQDIPAAPAFNPADVKPIVEPIVDWPPDDQRRVVALRLVAPPPERLAGRALRLALASEGFVLGKFQIFHKPDESGRAVLSAANLSKPGTFDLQTMDTQRYGGLSLFAVLPGPKPSQRAFDDLLATARNLNERLQGALQDERGGPLTPTRIATLRDSLGTEAS